MVCLQTAGLAGGSLEEGVRSKAGGGTINGSANLYSVLVWSLEDSTTWICTLKCSNFDV